MRKWNSYARRVHYDRNLFKLKNSWFLSQKFFVKPFQELRHRIMKISEVRVFNDLKAKAEPSNLPVLEQIQSLQKGAQKHVDTTLAAQLQGFLQHIQAHRAAVAEFMVEFRKSNEYNQWEEDWILRKHKDFNVGFLTNINNKQEGRGFFQKYLKKKQENPTLVKEAHFEVARNFQDKFMSFVLRFFMVALLDVDYSAQRILSKVKEENEKY